MHPPQIPIWLMTVKGEVLRQDISLCCCPPAPPHFQLYNPPRRQTSPSDTASPFADMSSATINNYTTWTPEQLMRDYHGELKRELFLRCMEWYTVPEVEAKINAGRSDGTKIKSSNFYAEFRLIIETVALRDGHLPTEYKLQFDKRRFINLDARFGSENETVRRLRSSIRKRDAILCMFASLQ